MGEVGGRVTGRVWRDWKEKGKWCFNLINMLIKMYVFLQIKEKLKILSDWGRCQLWASTYKHTHMSVGPYGHLCHMRKTDKYTYKVTTCITVFLFTVILFLFVNNLIRK